MYLSSKDRVSVWGIFGGIGLGLLILLATGFWMVQGSHCQTKRTVILTELPTPRHKSDISLEAAISNRRSLRRFVSEQLSLADIGQLCWSAQGITDRTRSYRASPSAGALYPLELYVFSVRGVERYRPIQHALEQYDHRDLRKQLSQAALGQESVANAPAVFVITGVVQRTAAIYKERAYRYMLLEVGHASQNLFLQAVALGLNGVAVGAFEDSKVTKLMRLPPDETPLYILPIGRKSTTTQIHK